MRPPKIRKPRTRAKEDRTVEEESDLILIVDNSSLK
jgi:hypothetical protein